MTNKLFLAAVAALIFSIAFIFIAATSPSLTGKAARTSAVAGEQEQSDEIYIVKAIDDRMMKFTL